MLPSKLHGLILNTNVQLFYNIDLVSGLNSDRSPKKKKNIWLIWLINNYSLNIIFLVTISELYNIFVALILQMFLKLLLDVQIIHKRCLR